MIDPVTLGAGVIAKLAFDEFVKAGAGEVATAAVAGVGNLAKTLRDRIMSKFKDQNNERAIATIAEVEQGNEAALTKLTKYIDLEMDEDPEFAGQLRQTAQQIINIQNQNTNTLNQQNNNYGRDQIVINNPSGDLSIGG